MLTRLSYYGEMLRNDPLNLVLYLAYFGFAILLSLMLHEIAHGFVAWKCGDPTAKMMGRLTLDPSKHLDPIGTVCMVLLGVGWARPVPVNPRNFRHYRRDDFLVSIAGIVTNLALFLVSTTVTVLLSRVMWDADFYQYARENGMVEAMVSPFWNIGYGLMTGTLDARFTTYLAVPWLQYIIRLMMMMSQINLSLAMFNLLPIPPLDGYHIVNDLLLKGRLQLNRTMFQAAQVLLIVAVMSGVLSNVLSTMIGAVYDAALRVLLLIA